MSNVSVKSVTYDGITFSDGTKLYSKHLQDCCESHELTFSDLTLSDFDGLEFDLRGGGFFRKIPEFGIELLPVHGHPVRIPGHGYNNGYYGTDLTLVLENTGVRTEYNITECQVIHY